MVRDTKLLDSIEKEAIDGDIERALRLCIKLGSHGDSGELREWALRELRGYEANDNLPSYRRIMGSLRYDAISPGWRISGQELSPLAIPEGIRDDIDPDIPISHGINVVMRQSERDASTMTTPELGLAREIMNAQQQSPQVMSIYWSVDGSEFAQICSRVRTELVELVAKCRASIAIDGTLQPAAIGAIGREMVRELESPLQITGDHNIVQLNQGASGNAEMTAMRDVSGSATVQRARRLSNISKRTKISLAISIPCVITIAVVLRFAPF